MSLDKILKTRGLMSQKEYDSLMMNKKFLSTGYPNLDEEIGGIPIDAVTEVAGPSGIGKSRFVKDICLRPDLRALYIDTENSLSAREYEQLKANMDVVSEGQIENIWGLVNDVLDDKLYDIIAVDSLAIATTQAELDDDNTMSMSSALAKAKVMYKWLRGIKSHLMGSGCALIFVNHLNQKPGPVPMMVTPGGAALEYFSSLRLFFTGGASKLSGTKQTIKVKVSKSRNSVRGATVDIKLDVAPKL